MEDIIKKNKQQKIINVIKILLIPIVQIILIFGSIILGVGCWDSEQCTDLIARITKYIFIFITIFPLIKIIYSMSRNKINKTLGYFAIIITLIVPVKVIYSLILNNSSLIIELNKLILP